MSEDRGRPVPPHRSGGGSLPEGHNGHDLGPEFIASTLPDPKAPVDQPAPQERESEPVFEVIIPSELAGVNAPAFHLKFWPDGKIEGFEALAARRKRMTVINRIPALINTLFTPLRDYMEDVDAVLNVMAPAEAQVVQQGGGSDG